MTISVAIKKHLPTFDLDVAFEVGNDTLGLLGASGGGKSLTLRCIAGLETPDEGRIVVDDTVYFDSEKGINLSAQQRKTAMLFQNYMLFPNLTVAQNIAAGIDRNKTKAEVHVIIKEQLKRFGLEGFGKRYPARLSGGQQQRVALARMLAADTHILMLDEPFSALDAHLKASLEQDMLDLFESYGGSILYISHDIDEAFHFCDHIAVLDRGKLCEIAPTPQIVSHPQSLATLKVSGVKNISPVRRISEHSALAEAWGITLTCKQEVAHDAAFLGVRASYLSRATGQAHNVFPCRVHRTSDSRFERVVTLEILAEGLSRSDLVSRKTQQDTEPTPASPAPAHPPTLQWRVSKLAVPEADLPVRGQELNIHIPADQIYLVAH